MMKLAIVKPCCSAYFKNRVVFVTDQHVMKYQRHSFAIGRKTIPGASEIVLTVRSCFSLKASSVNDFEPSMDSLQWFKKIPIKDIMTRNPYYVTPDTSIFAAMEMLNEKKVSGLAVVDDSGIVIGVVSAYDILACDVTPGNFDKSAGFFPPVDKCHTEYGGDRSAMWREFLGLRKALEKAKATNVAESMHDTYTVNENTSISDVADIIVRKRLHRIFVEDDNKKLVGVVSRGDVVKATIMKYRNMQA